MHDNAVKMESPIQDLDLVDVNVAVGLLWGHGQDPRIALCPLPPSGGSGYLKELESL